MTAPPTCRELRIYEIACTFRVPVDGPEEGEPTAESQWRHIAYTSLAGWLVMHRVPFGWDIDPAAIVRVND